MTIIATFHLVGIAPYSQSKPQLAEYEPNESHDGYRKRTWREHLHVDKNGMVFIPPGALKNSIAEAAKFLALKIPAAKVRLTQNIAKLIWP